MNHNICYIAVKKKPFWKAIYLFVLYLIFCPYDLPGCLVSLPARIGVADQKRGQEGFKHKSTTSIKESSHPTQRKPPCQAGTSWGQTLEQQAKEDVSSEGQRKKGSPSLARCSLTARFPCYKWRALVRM